MSLSHAVFIFIEQNSTPVYEMFPMRNMAPDEVDISFNLATQVAELMTFLVEAQVFQYCVFQSFGRWRL